MPDSFVDPELVDRLERMPVSELSSLMLEVYRRKAQEISPAGLLRKYTGNRFVKPSGLSVTQLARLAAPFVETLADHIKSHAVCRDIALSTTGNRYYRGVRFKIFVTLDGSRLELAEGGFVDWSQKILGSKKERVLISGLGVERILTCSLFSNPAS
jgi:hypothetical protein